MYETATQEKKLECLLKPKSVFAQGKEVTVEEIKLFYDNSYALPVRLLEIRFSCKK
jgi:hypothetical protein